MSTEGVSLEIEGFNVTYHAGFRATESDFEERKHTAFRGRAITARRLFRFGSRGLYGVRPPELDGSSP